VAGLTTVTSGKCRSYIYLVSCLLCGMTAMICLQNRQGHKIIAWFWVKKVRISLKEGPFGLVMFHHYSRFKHLKMTEKAGFERKYV